ncbi:L-dopachrome tautomerase-related protein [soil metagenome]
MSSLFYYMIGLCAFVGCQSSSNNAPRSAATHNDAPRADSRDRARLARSDDRSVPSSGDLQVVALFDGSMPTGVTVSRDGRVFICMPRWGDPVEFTVGELRDGKLQPYPNLAMNRLDTKHQADSFVSVQSVVVDPQDRLWVLDTGSINFQPNNPGGPKLLCFDLITNRLVKRISFPAGVVRPTSYLNDVRFNLTMGKEGVAFITDSSDGGPNGIVVVDLASGSSWRKLNDHPSTKADPNFVPTVEGQPLKVRAGDRAAEATIKIGSDGIAISNDGKLLFYSPLASHRIYSVSTEALADGKLSDAETSATVRELGPRDFASDGLSTDVLGNLLLTDYEHNAIRRRETNSDQSKFEIIAQDPRLIWPDTLAVDSEGWVYVIANQLNRQPRFQGGKEMRQPPYVLFKFKPMKPGRRLAEANASGALKAAFEK